MASTTHNRRTLHQPLNPFISTPSPPTTTPPPFFPYPPPPPSLPTFPLSNQSSHHRSLTVLIAIPAAVITLLFALTTLFLLRQCKRHNQQRGNDQKPSTAPSSPTATSEINSHCLSTTSSPPNILDSPELRPLPPLARNVKARSLAPTAVSGAKNAGVMEKCGSPASTLSFPSYLVTSPSPLSLSPVSLSPGRSTVGSPSSGGAGSTPPPPPAPPRLLRPMPPLSFQIPAKTMSIEPRSQFTKHPPPAPPPPPVVPVRPIGAMSPPDVEKKGEYNITRPKLKPLHWDKVRASSDMVWDHLRSCSFELNEETITALFGCEATNSASKEAASRQFSRSPSRRDVILDPKKSHNIEIQLRALSATKEEVCQALLECNADSLSNDLLESLLKMAPSRDEELKLKEYRDDFPSKLGPAELFLKTVLDIPLAFKRMDAMLYISNFDSEVDSLWNSFETIKAACTELRSNRLFLKLLEAVLKTGNRMNVGTRRGNAQAFKLDTLLKLVDVKGTDGKTTLLHFVVQEISKAEGLRIFAGNRSTVRSNLDEARDVLECKMLGLEVVSSLGRELNNVRKAATMESDVLSSPISKLANGIGKIRELLRLNAGLNLRDKSEHLQNAMTAFLEYAEDKIMKLQGQERISMALVKELTVYFHGDSAKEEVHPLRLFMVVKDFLSVLDQVCKEIGRISEQTTASSTHRVSSPASQNQFSAFPRLKN